MVGFMLLLSDTAHNLGLQRMWLFLSQRYVGMNAPHSATQRISTFPRHQDHQGCCDLTDIYCLETYLHLTTAKLVLKGKAKTVGYCHNFLPSAVTSCSGIS